MYILVADDDLPNVKLTAFVLEEAGYKVIKPTMAHQSCNRSSSTIRTSSCSM